MSLPSSTVLPLPCPCSLSASRSGGRGCASRARRARLDRISGMAATRAISRCCRAATAGAGAVLVLSPSPLYGISARSRPIAGRHLEIGLGHRAVSPTDAAVAIGWAPGASSVTVQRRPRPAPRSSGRRAPTRRAPRRSSNRFSWRAISSPRRRPTWGRPSSPKRPRRSARRTRPRSR